MTISNWLKYVSPLALGLCVSLSACSKGGEADEPTQADAESQLSDALDADIIIESGDGFATTLLRTEYQAINDRFEVLQSENGDTSLVVPEWEDLRVRAEADGDAVLVAKIDVDLAFADYDRGDPQSALERLERASPVLMSVLDTEYVTNAALQALSLRSLLLTQGGEAEKAVAIAQDTLEQFDRMEAERPDVDFKTNKTMAMLKSNIEFSTAQALMRLGRGEEALELQRRSYRSRLGAYGPNSADVISSRYGLAQALLKAGYIPEAEREARGAVAQATTHLDPSQQQYVRSMEMLGIVLARSDRPMEGARVLDRALQIKAEQTGRDDLGFAFGIFNLGGIQRDNGNYESAARLLPESAKGFIQHQGEASPFAASAFALAGGAEFALGDEIEAGAYLEDALARLKPSDESVAVASALLADIEGDAARLDGLDLSGDTPERRYARAVQARLTGAPDVEPLLTSVWARDNLIRSGRLDFMARLSVEEALRGALAANDTDRALEAMALLLNNTATQSAFAGEARLASLDADALRTYQTLSRQRARIDSARLIAISKDEPLEAFDAQLADLDEKLGALGVAEVATRRVQPTLVNLQSGLANDEALLAFVPGLSRQFVLIVRSDAHIIVTLDSSRAEIAQAIKDARTALRQEDASTATTALTAVREALLPDAVMDSLSGARHMRLVASGAVSQLPLAALPLSDGTWLGDRFTMTVQSSLNTEAFAEIDGASRRLLAIGPPVDTGVPGGSASALAYRTDPTVALPNARAEIEALSDQFSGRAKTLLGPKASEAAFKSERLSRYDIIAFATHGLVDGERGDNSQAALLLGAGRDDDGYLETDEIAALELDADWVILSACNTAAPDAASQNGYSGLVSGFLEAGARSLMVSHWPVRDDAAARLSTRTVALSETMSPEQALQQAMRELRDSDLPEADHPRHWAPFVIYRR